MLKFACFCVAIAMAVPAWSQVEPAATGGGFELDDLHMMTPPPVSNDAYPVVVGAETRSNYLDAALTFTGAYVDNLMLGPTSVGDEIYYFVPSVSLDRRTARQGETLHYSPGFTLYQNQSQINGISQDASANYRLHITPYAVIQIGDSFTQNYNLYNQSNPLNGGGPVSGTPGGPNTVLIAPFANAIVNSTSAGLDYQYGKNAMVGGRGLYSFLHYGNDAPGTGLNNANTKGGMAFFSRRIARSEYVGAAYQFSRFTTRPLNTLTESHTLYGFYTHYFTKNFSLSLLGGPERYASSAPGVPKREAWTPAVQGSLGWQTLRAILGASYSHLVSGAPGFGGAFQAHMTGVNGRWVFSRRWSAGMDGQYSSLKSVTPSLDPGGHTISAGADVARQLGERLGLGVGYRHFHQSYGGLTSATFTPDSNRAYISINYEFHRPLGR